MRCIAFFTTSRAEFGIFSALFREFECDSDIKYFLFVSAASVMTKSFGDNLLICGNPAKVIKLLDN